MKATLDTITLTIGEKQLTLTLEEAEAVRALLNDKLGGKLPEHPVERIIEKAPEIHFWPTYRETAPVRPGWLPEITCDSQGVARVDFGS